ncbi:MAG TPA: Tad domain-containing protein [Acidobacteriaceae bacterium]
MKLFTDERGQTTIVMMLTIASLCGMAGFAVDVGTLFHAKRMLQTAADAGAIAGSADRGYGTATASAKAATAQNGITDGVNGVVVTVNNPPLIGPHAGKSGFVEVTVTQTAPTFFMKVFHLTSMTVSARAVAANVPISGCIYTLDPSGIDIGLSGSGDLNMPDCGIVVDSASSNAVSLSNNAHMTAQSIGIVGGYSGAAANYSPLPITGIPPAADPLASRVSAPSFAISSCVSDPHPTGTVTMGPTDPTVPVCYNGLTMSGSGTITLEPGLYIINGGLSSSGSVNVVLDPAALAANPGAGVTFYLAQPNGSVSLTGSGALNVSAPNDSLAPAGTPPSPYDGILFYEDARDTNTMKVSGSNSSTIYGIFYAPSASLTLTGSTGTGFYADLVVHALNINGSNNIHNYSKINGNSPLAGAALVE